MTVIETAKLESSRLSAHETMQVYNGLDCCVTLEVFNTIKNYMHPEAQLSYDFKRAISAPALEMMLRGIRVNQYWRGVMIEKLSKERERLHWILNKYAYSVWKFPLNPASHVQMKSFFYDCMGLPKQYKFEKGERKVSTDRESLEKLSVYFYAQPIILCILAIRDRNKKIAVLKSEIDDDSRMRTSYNVAGTETDRWSSSKNSEGGGTNLQNITEELRRAFVADEGWKLAYIDLEQAESRAVGWVCFTLFGRHAYLDACESGDLHTNVSKLIWPWLPWTGDDKQDRGIAERSFYRWFTYRDMSKRGGHATNYVGQPPTVARHLKVHPRMIADFQSAYFNAFPEIRMYHQWCAKNLQINAKIRTPLGTSRQFFGRVTDDATLREAVAYVPQHMVGVLLNLALWRIWKFYGQRVQILGQVHDAILLQYREQDESEILPLLLACMETPLAHKTRKMVIPSDVAVGWNWAKFDDGTDPKKPSNLDGLKKWRGTDDRRRIEAAESSGLDQRIS